MTGERYNQRTWAKHYQDAWVADAAKFDTLPIWFRMMALAYGSHKANGHANFRRGDLAKVLGEPGPEGEWRPIDKGTIQKYIRYLISVNLLDPQSCSECLVVPRHRIEGGGTDYKTGGNSPCPVHMRKAAKRVASKRVVARRGLRFGAMRKSLRGTRKTVPLTCGFKNKVGLIDPPGGPYRPTSALEVGLTDPPRPMTAASRSQGI